MNKAFEKILEKLSNIHRVVKTDEDAEWNRAIYKLTEIVKEVAEEYEDKYVSKDEVGYMLDSIGMRGSHYQNHLRRVIDMTIDEAIELLKNCEYLTNREEKQIAEWLEELKTIKEMDLSIPQHFTKEQGEWIKKYCIQRNIEFYNKAIDDFVNFANTCPEIEEEEYIRGMSLEEMAECCKLKFNT